MGVISFCFISFTYSCIIYTFIYVVFIFVQIYVALVVGIGTKGPTLVPNRSYCNVVKLPNSNVFWRFCEGPKLVPNRSSCTVVKLPSNNVF